MEGISKMSIRTLALRTALPVALGEVRFSLSRFQAHPVGAPFVPVFQGLRDNWTLIHAKQLAFEEALVVARARIGICDDDCNDFASRVAKAILTITKDNRNHPLWTHFFGSKSLSRFTRPILAGQLAAMELWIPSLQQSPHPSLKDLAPELVTLVAAAKQAVADREACKHAIKQFIDVGERKQFMDALNGARKEAYGQLSKIAHATDDLPTDFASRFFYSEADEDDAKEPETLESVKTLIAELTQELEGAKARLAALEQQEAEAKQAEAKRAEQEALLAALAEEEAAIAQKKAALLAQMQA